MSKTDPYTVLGLQRNASPDEIKSAYRKLARTHHPDVNNNSKASQFRFREIAEAYEILSDSEKRTRFDRFGRAEAYDISNGFGRSSYYRTGGYSGSSRWYDYGRSPEFDSPFEDILSAFFAGHSGRRGSSFRAARGRDLEVGVTVDFEQAYHGAKLSMEINGRPVECNLPAGVDSGSRIRYQGLGEPGVYGGPRGDLILIVTVSSHAFFTREENDIYLDLPISIGEALLGSSIKITGPDGKLLLKIPRHTQPGTVFRFRGKGFTSLKTGFHGDFFVKVKVVIPREVDPISLDLIAEFEKRNPLNSRWGL
jgi:DnaJ-class molecular chaperone